MLSILLRMGGYAPDKARKSYITSTIKIWRLPMRGKINWQTYPLLPLVAIILVSGCQSSYNFKVDAINNPEIASEELKSYTIVSSNAEISESDLEFKEAAEYVRTALSSKGYYEAPDVEHADMIIDISYGVGEPQIDFKTYSNPVYATRGGGYSTVATPVVDGKGNVTYVTTTVYHPPRVEMVGIEEKIVPITTYEKFLRLTSRDNREIDESEGPVQVWSIYVKNKDESDDLRKYLPLMAAASVPHIGENTESQTEVKLKEKDDLVGFVKEGM